MPASASRAAFVLDTSAIFTLCEGEEGIATIKDILRRARRRRVSAIVSLMSIYEILYVTSQERGEAEALRRVLEVRALPVIEAPLSPEIAIRAAHLKSRRQISVADSWIAATAVHARATLVHKDPEFLPLGDEITLETLPLK